MGVKHNQPFSLNTISLARRVIEKWSNSRQEKFFQDVGLGRLYRGELEMSRKTPSVFKRSKTYLISDMFEYITTKQRKILFDDI